MTTPVASSSTKATAAAEGHWNSTLTSRYKTCGR
jgi:hypothetical protein